MNIKLFNKQKAATPSYDPQMIQTIKNVVANKLSLSPDYVSDNADLHDDLGADSLNVVEIVMDLEDEFNVSIGDDELNEVHKVSDLYALCSAK